MNLFFIFHIFKTIFKNFTKILELYYAVCLHILVPLWRHLIVDFMSKLNKADNNGPYKNQDNEKYSFTVTRHTEQVVHTPPCLPKAKSLNSVMLV